MWRFPACNSVSRWQKLKHSIYLVAHKYVFITLPENRNENLIKQLYFNLLYTGCWRTSKKKRFCLSKKKTQQFYSAYELSLYEVILIFNQIFSKSDEVNKGHSHIDKSFSTICLSDNSFSMSNYLMRLFILKAVFLDVFK